MQNSLAVTTRPIQFAAPVVQKIAVGQNIADIITSTLKGQIIGAICCELNGIEIPKSKWTEIYPKADDHLLIFTKIAGGGGGNKSPLRIFLTVVLIVAVAYFAPMAGGALANTLGGSSAVWGAAAGMAMMTAGTLLINAIAPIKPPESDGAKSNKESRTYSLSGSQNSADPFGPIPVVLGTHRVFPRYAAKPYTEIIGNDEYLHMLFCWGYAPISVGSLKIGDTPIDSFDDVNYQTFLSFKSGDALPEAYPTLVNQISVGVTMHKEDEIDTEADWSVRQMDNSGYDELSVDFYFPRGICYIDDRGARISYSVSMGVRYREVGTSTWYGYTGTVNYLAQNLSVLADRANNLLKGST